MKNLVKLFEDAINDWRVAKGHGTALIPKPLDDKVMILGILQKIYARSPTVKTLLLVNDYNERIDIIEKITHDENEENNSEFKRLINEKSIMILTYDFIKNKSLHLFPYLIILYHPNEIDNKTLNLLEVSKFKLVVMNKLISNPDDSVKLYKHCPILNSFKNNEIMELRYQTPVEETQIGIALDSNSDDYKLLKYYDDYIGTSITIFGDFNKINEARLGNQTLNISSSQVCEQIGRANGWRPGLDMNVGINRQVDELYSPASIRDRANLTFEIIRKRSTLVASNESKLKKIYEIVSKNSDKKILIISKFGEFANKVTDYLNNMSESNICGNYHDKIQPIPAVDFNGNPVYYKSGANKGKRKMMAAQAQKTYNEYCFNNDKINVLSCSNSPDKELDIHADIIIITSPLCESLRNYIYRLDNLWFNDKIILYTLYVTNSLEEKQLNSRKTDENHVIVNKYDENENNCDFVIAD